MTRGALTLWVASFLLGAALGWRDPDPPAVSEGSAAAAPNDPRPCPQPDPAAIREVRIALEQRTTVREGALRMEFGPPLVAPAEGYDPETVRAEIARVFTVGTVHYSSCEQYPCAGVWDLTGADLDLADAQLEAFRASYPASTTSFWQDGGAQMGHLANQVPFIVHGPVDFDVAAGSPDAEAQRIYWMSRALKAETRYRLGDDAVRLPIDADGPPQGTGVPRAPVE